MLCPTTIGSNVRILIYLEPHPVPFQRDTLKDIGRRFLCMLQEAKSNHANADETIADCRVFVSDRLRHITREFPNLKHSLIFPSKGEASVLQQYEMDSKDQERAIAGWKDLMLGRGELIEFYEDLLQRVKTSIFDFDVIVYWGANGAVQRFSKERGIRCVSLSAGCISPRIYDSLYLSSNAPQVNSLAHGVELDRIESVSLEALQSLLPISMIHGMHMDAAFRPLSIRHASEIYRNIGRNVLIPLQLRDDPNVILGCEYHSMLAFLRQVLPILLERGYVIYILPHPSDKTRCLNRADHAAASVYCKSFKNVVWLADIDRRKDYLSLLKKMDVVVTINSRSGFDAMVMGKPVIPLGVAAYNLGRMLTLSDLGTGDPGLLRRRQLKEHTCRVVNLLLRQFLVPKAFAFKFPNFLSYVHRVIQCQSIYDSEGAVGLTDFLNMAPPIGLRNVDLMDPSSISQDREEVPGSLVDEVKFQSKRDVFERMQRKLRKLWLDPRKFLIDSRYGFLRMLGRCLVVGRK